MHHLVIAKVIETFKITPVLGVVGPQIPFYCGKRLSGILKFEVLQLQHSEGVLRASLAEHLERNLYRVCLVMAQKAMRDLCLKVGLLNTVLSRALPTTHTLPEFGTERVGGRCDSCRQLVELYAFGQTVRKLVKGFNQHFSVRKCPRLTCQSDSRVNAFNDFLKGGFWRIKSFKCSDYLGVHGAPAPICCSLDAITHAARKAKHELVLFGNRVVCDRAFGHLDTTQNFMMS